APGHAHFRTGQVLGEQSHYMVIQDNGFIHHFAQVGGKHPDGGAAATHPHFGVFHPVNDGTVTYLKLQHSPVILTQGYSLAVTIVDDGPGHHKTGFPGEKVGPADRKHFGTVFLRVHHAHYLAVAPDFGAFLTDKEVGINLHLDPAVAQRSLGDHGHHV